MIPNESVLTPVVASVTMPVIGPATGEDVISNLLLENGNAVLTESDDYIVLE